MKDYDTRAMAAWLLSSLLVSFAINNLIADLVIVSSAVLVGWSASSRTSSLRALILVGVTVTSLRTLLFALTGHSGSMILFHIPEFTLSLPLSRLELGGAVTYEAVAQGISEGLRLMVIFACFGAFLAHVRVIDLLRIVPRFLFDAALVLNISIVLAPVIAREIRDVKEAQLMRGNPKRRSLNPVSTIMPVFTGAIERSVSLAEAMESRGFGRVGGDSRVEANWRLLAIMSVGISSTTGVFLLVTHWPILAVGTCIFLGLLFLALRRLSSLVTRTSYSNRRPGLYDRLIWTVSIIAVGLAIASHSPMWDPYSTPLPPSPSPLQVFVAALILFPAACHALRTPTRLLPARRSF